jgi:hypothetical protein
MVAPIIVDAQHRHPSHAAEDGGYFVEALYDHDQILRRSLMLSVKFLHLAKKNHTRQPNLQEGSLLFLCSVLFGSAYGLSHQRGLVQSPAWFAGGLPDFCFFIMAWTALTNSRPLVRAAWTLTDFFILSLPAFANPLFSAVLFLQIPTDYFSYLVLIGWFSAAGCVAVAAAQFVYYLLDKNVAGEM